MDTAAPLDRFVSNPDVRERWRWARFGIVAMRMLVMPAVRRAAEQRWRSDRRASS
jgi:hypothetical protein